MPDLTDLPPRRTLPADVRARARRELLDGIRPREHRRPARLAAVLATAAAVLILPAFGALLVDAADVTPTATDGPVNDNFKVITPEERYAARDGAPTETADRCRAAAPDQLRDAQPLLTASDNGVTVIVFRSADGERVRFCELSPATVAVSADTSRASSGTAATVTFRSALGTIAGVTGADVPHLFVRDPIMQTQMTDDGDPALMRDGIFVLPNAVTAAATELQLTVTATGSRDAQISTLTGSELPAPAPPTTDRPQPAADRTSEAGKQLGRCFSDPKLPPVADAGAWIPAATLRLTDDESVYLARLDGLLATCIVRSTEGPQLTIDDGHRIPWLPAYIAANPYLFGDLAFYDFKKESHGGSSSDTVVVTALVTDSRVASVALSRPHRAPITAYVQNQTVLLPGIGLNENRDSSEDTSTLTLYDSNGRELDRVPVGQS
ncbi:hypothetical protein [Actinoplanes couchii]|uniref:Uncharacterized protein n=1 Tax=Actinoplanes couchii TaxID=403638 RepID=A0ABQ3XTR6_9ACTN|nr:hypothetical protein [Actinoplanes couchii]MDR6319029.1 hypothetical protein [Actinoplanes couchii]GID61902.1 hypothetical protein Aco03nite_103060 [Actinoplanes couchii]